MSEPRRFWVVLTKNGYPIHTTKNQAIANETRENICDLWPDSTIIEVQEIQPEEPK